MTCPTCGREAVQFIKNLQTQVNECQRCSFGPDEMRLRVVELVLRDGFEIHHIRALNNLDAFHATVGDRVGKIKEMFAMPLPETDRPVISSFVMRFEEN